MKDRLIVSQHRGPRARPALMHPTDLHNRTPLTKVTGFCTPPMPSAAKKASPASPTKHLKYYHLALRTPTVRNEERDNVCLKEKVGHVTFLGTINTGIERKRQRIASWRCSARFGNGCYCHGIWVLFRLNSLGKFQGTRFERMAIDTGCGWEYGDAEFGEQRTAGSGESVAWRNLEPTLLFSESPNQYVTAICVRYASVQLRLLSVMSTGDTWEAFLFIVYWSHETNYSLVMKKLWPSV